MYEIEVLPTPALVDFKVGLDYPNYTKRIDEEVKNTGDITVPIGTKIEWQFSTRNTDKLSIKYHFMSGQIQVDVRV